MSFDILNLVKKNSCNFHCLKFKFQRGAFLFAYCRVSTPAESWSITEVSMHRDNAYNQCYIGNPYEILNWSKSLLLELFRVMTVLRSILFCLFLNFFFWCRRSSSNGRSVPKNTIKFPCLLCWIVNI